MSISQQDDLDKNIALLQQVQATLLLAQQQRSNNDQNNHQLRQQVLATLLQAQQHNNRQLPLPSVSPQSFGYNTPTTLSRTFSGSSSAGAVAARSDSAGSDM